MNNKTELFSHMKGEIIPMDKVEDETFSQKILGDGIAVNPSEGKLVAPCDGSIETVFRTGHALNMKSSEGCDIIIHIGIDTINLKGKYFTAHVKDKDTVKKGDLLISFDLEKIKAEGYKLTTPLIVCDMDKYNILPVATGKVSFGDKVIELTKKG